METDRYVQILRAHWLMILLTTIICTGAAAAYAWTREDVYAAHTQLFVSTPVAPKDLTPSEVYQGGLASQGRAESYARLISSPDLAEAIVNKLNLDRSVQFVQSAISASVLPGTVLMDVTVEDPSPSEAKEIADAVGEEFPHFVNQLEGGSKGESADKKQQAVHVTVSSPAELPTSPEGTSKAFYLVGGALIGLMLGIGGAVLREAFDRRIKDDESIEAVAGAMIIGHIPRDRKAKRRPLVVIEDSLSVEAEAYRRLRTNLRVVALEQGRQSLLVTSAVSGEGKTLISANLAFAFAQTGRRTILVDGDMRSAKLTELLGLTSGPGLSDVLKGASRLPLHEERHLPLSVLSSGTSQTNPSELLESPGLGSLVEVLKEQSDVIIFDAPPLLPVSDAAILARAVDAVLLVTRSPSTQQDLLTAAADALDAVGIQPVGVALNGVSAPVGGSYAYDRINADKIPEPRAPVWD